MAGRGCRASQQHFAVGELSLGAADFFAQHELRCSAQQLDAAFADRLAQHPQQEVFDGAAVLPQQVGVLPKTGAAKVEATSSAVATYRASISAINRLPGCIEA